MVATSRVTYRRPAIPVLPNAPSRLAFLDRDPFLLGPTLSRHGARGVNTERQRVTASSAPKRGKTLFVVTFV
jgi:hypothetical protein